MMKSHHPFFYVITKQSKIKINAPQIITYLRIGSQNHQGVLQQPSSFELSLLELLLYQYQLYLPSKLED